MFVFLKRLRIHIRSVEETAYPIFFRCHVDLRIKATTFSVGKHVWEMPEAPEKLQAWPTKQYVTYLKFLEIINGFVRTFQHSPLFCC